ncbi:MAG TPA: hypothetical protein VLI67_00780, partial [Vicinamibacteria bacterium]|nr:hypothetical protein [Vicinamibacteria bacterium]
MAAALGRSLTALLRRREAETARAGAGAVLAVCSLLPLLLLLVEAAASSGEALDALRGARVAGLLARSASLSLAVTALALAVGVPLGVLVGRTDARGRWAAALVHVFPAFLPPFLLALGWFHVFGARGLLGSEATSRALFGEAGTVAVLTFAFAPIATALTALGLQGIDPGLEEAARVVARPGRVVARILLPAAAPALALAAIVVFTLAFSELGVPMFLRVDTFPAAVFARLGGIDYAPGEAFALTLPLVPLALLLLALERRFAGSRSYAVLGARSIRPDTLPLGRWRGLASFLLWLVAALSAAPVAALAWRAARGGDLGSLAGWTGRAPWNSLWTSAAAATVIVAVGLILGHAVARRTRGSAAFDALSVLAFVTPAGVLGVGLIAVWNRPALQSVYGTAAILVVGFVARYAVIGLRTV